MDSLNLHMITDELNQKALTHSIGTLQDIRAELKQMSRKPCQSIFSSQTTHDKYALHHGGRSELQFNIGFENVSGALNLRYGVAFSFETSRTLPNIDVLVPKIRLFNEFLSLYSELYADMRMWHYYGNEEKSSDYMPSPIPHELVIKDVFVFLGKRQPLDHLEYDPILDDFDRLLPLYKFVESGGRSQPISRTSNEQFAFRPGCSVKVSSTMVTHAKKQLDVNLRHNELQSVLHRKLVSEYGKENVGAELSSGVGTSVDVVVRRNDVYWFYEIKTAQSPRACLREALGQLLEYSFWPGAQEARRLIVVGESALDKDGEEYIRRLKKIFSLPIEYEQIVIEDTSNKTLE